MRRKQKLLLTATALVFMAVIATMLLDISLPADSAITGMATDTLEQTMYCKDYDMQALKTTNLASCLNYQNEFQISMQKNGLRDLGIDPLLVMSMAYQESTCNPFVNKGGILQVDDPCLLQDSCPDVQTQIDEGLKIFSSNINTLKQKQGLNDQEVFVLALFAYNRGLTTANNAVSSILKANRNERKKDFLKDGTLPAYLEDALKDSCYTVYSNTNNCDGQTYCLYDSRHIDKCVGQGYGVNYVTKILEIYANNCELAGGQIKLGEYEPSKSKSLYFGTYETMPHFTVKMQNNLSIYDSLQEFVKKTVNDCTDNVESCLDAKIRQFSLQDYTLERDCETGQEKVFYDFIENLYDCTATKDDQCVCNLAEDYTRQTIKDKGLKHYYELLFEDYDQNLETLRLSLKDSGIYQVIGWPSGIAMPKEYAFKYTDSEYKDGNIKLDSGEVKGDSIGLYIDKNSQTPFTFTNDFSKPVCANDKNRFRMCAVSKQDMQQYDSESQKMVMKPLTIKFAVTLVDNPPATLDDVLVQTIKDDSQTLLVSWTASNAADLAFYKVYYSTMDFEDQKPGNTNSAVLSFRQETSLLPGTFGEVQMFCSGQCYYRLGTVLLDNDKIYQSTDNVVFVLLDNSQQFVNYAGVVALDSQLEEPASFVGGQNYGTPVSEKEFAQSLWQIP